MIKKLLFVPIILFIAGNSFATTWFSCNGDSFCGANYWNYSTGGVWDISADPTSPEGNANVWRLKFPAGFPGGEGVGNVDVSMFTPQNAKEMWVQFYYKVSAGFQFHPVEMKLYMFYPANTIAMGLKPTIGAECGTQGGGQCGYPNVRTDVWYTTSSRGVWHKYKAHFKQETSAGANNGIYQAWIDDIMVSKYSNSAYGTAAAPFTAQQFVIIWGGMGGTVATTQYLYFDGIYIGSTDPGAGSTINSKTPSPPGSLKIEF